VRDIWSFSRIWQDFAEIAPHMADATVVDSAQHGSASFCRNLLLTKHVCPFLSNPADTPASRETWCGTGTRSNRLCARRQTATLFGGMMPFEKIEKSLHEGR